MAHLDYRDIISRSNIFKELKGCQERSQKLSSGSFCSQPVQVYLRQEGYQRVKVLDVSQMNLEDAEDVLSLCQNVEFLFLRQNSINSFSKIANNLHNLQVLDLTGNMLQTLGYRIFWEHLKQLKVLLLGDNQIQDDISQIRLLAPLTQLVELSLYNNPLSQNELYQQTVAQALPWLLVLDKMIFSCVMATEFRASYDNSIFFQSRRRFSGVYGGKAPTLLLQRNVCALAAECSQIVATQAHCCPILIIQKCLRTRRTQRNIEMFTRGYVRNIVMVQAAFRRRIVLSVNRLQIAQIKISTRRAHRLKRKWFRRAIQIASAISIHRGRILRIQFAISLQKIARYCMMNHTQAIESLHNSNGDVCCFLLAKTASPAHHPIDFIVALCQTVVEQLDSQLADHAGPFTCSMVTYQYTEYQFLGSPALIIRRNTGNVHAYPTTPIPLLSTHAQQRYQNVNRCISYKWRDSNDNVRSIQADVRTNRSIVRQFGLCRGTQMPMCLLITVRHKTLAAIFSYLISLSEIKIFGSYSTDVPISGTKTDTADSLRVELGRHIFKNHTSKQLQQQLYHLVRSNEVHGALGAGGQDSRVYMFRRQTARRVSAAIKVQKVYRALKSNKNVIQYYRDLHNICFNSLYDVFRYLVSVRVIQTGVRSYIANRRVLILSKMVNAYKSAIANEFLLIRRENLHKLVNHSIYAVQWPLKCCLHNISPVVNRKCWRNLFYTDANDNKDDIDRLMDLIHREMPAKSCYDTQLITLSRNYDEVFNHMTDVVYCKEHQNNYAVVQINSNQIPQLELYQQKRFQSYVDRMNLQKVVEVADMTGVEISSAYSSEGAGRYKSPVAALSLQNQQNESIVGSQLANSFTISSSFQLQSNKEFDVHFLQNTQIIGDAVVFLRGFLSSNGAPKGSHMANVLAHPALTRYVNQLCGQYYIIKHKIDRLQQQLAVKAYALENRYYAPALSTTSSSLHFRLLSNECNNYTLCTLEGLLVQAAAICIQCHSRSWLTRMVAKGLQTNLNQKLHRIMVQSGIIRANMELYADLEKYTVHRLQQRRRIAEQLTPERPARVAQVGGGITVARPVFYSRIRRNCILQNRIARCQSAYDRSVQRVCRLYSSKKILEHNQTVCIAVKDFVKGAVRPRTSSAKVALDLSALKNIHCRTKVKQATLDEAYKNQILDNQKQLIVPDSVFDKHQNTHCQAHRMCNLNKNQVDRVERRVQSAADRMMVQRARQTLQEERQRRQRQFADRWRQKVERAELRDQILQNENRKKVIKQQAYAQSTQQRRKLREQTGRIVRGIMRDE